MIETISTSTYTYTLGFPVTAGIIVAIVATIAAAILGSCSVPFWMA